MPSAQQNNRCNLIPLRASSKKEQNKDKTSVSRETYAKALIGYVIFCGVLVITLSSFISLELAAMNFGLFAVVITGAVEFVRRRKWENASDFKIQNLQKTQENLRDDILRQHDAIHTTKENLARVNDQVDFIKRNYAYVKNGLGQTGHDGAAADNAQSRVSSLIANDDPFADHASLSDMVVQELVRNAVKNERIDIFVQPIVRLPQRKTIAYEVYARIRAKAGLYVPAGRYMSLARRQNVAGAIDNLLLIRTLKILREQAQSGMDTQFFVNIEPASLKNGKFMRGLLSFLANNRAMAKKLVFEMPYADFNALPAPILQIMDALALLGTTFSLDHVKETDIDMRHLLKHHVRYLKMKGDWMLTHTKSDLDFTHLWRMKQKLEANGIRVIADHIENDATLLELFDFDPHYGQGFLFGKPDMPGAYEPFAYAKQFTRRQGVKESFG